MVAGWTINRLAKVQQAVRHSSASTAGAAQGTCQSLPLTRSEVLGLQGAEVAALARPVGDDARPRLKAPHLVSSNTSQDMQLSRIVEMEIIPRLMLMHSAQPLMARLPMPALTLTPEHVQTLARLAVEGDADNASSFVRALLDAGAAHEQIFLDLLAPCARLLGELWEDDRVDFSQVTIGLWRLQRVLHEQGTSFNQVAWRPADSRRAMLAAVPGAQHTFGLVMVAEFFIREGWDVDCEPKATWGDLRTRLADNWFDMFGLSIATSDSVAQVASAILDIRESSANQQIFIMVGGPLAARMPDLGALCGADAMACDANGAVLAANNGVAARVKRV